MIKSANIIFRDKYSITALLIAVVVIGYLVFNAIPLNVFAYDVLGYYLYLPMSFKYSDITLNNFDHLQSILSTYNTSEGFYQAFRVENGNYVMKYPMGMAIMYYPFYVIGDNIAHLLKYPTDGFSLPYQLSVLYGCYLYTIIGLIAFRKVLLNFFADKITAIVLLLIVFGTNYLLQVSIHAQPTMVHNLVFSLHALTLYNTIKWYKTYKLKYIIYLGITIGLAAISRPTEILIVFIPLLYNVYNFQTLKQKLVLFYLYKKQVVAFLCIVFVIGSYQLFYWKIVTGKFLFDSYSDNLNEGFNFSQPYILEFLFSFRKGWLLYTPIMIFAIIGFYQLYKVAKPWFFAFLFYFIISLYIMSSWSCWWYAVSFSSRAIIPAYVILSVSLGFFITKMSSSGAKFILFPTLLLLIGLNLFQSWQMAHGILDGARTTRQYYKSTFMQTTHPTAEQREMLLIDKYSQAAVIDLFRHHMSQFKRVYETRENFDTKSKDQANIIDSVSFSKPHCFVSNKDFAFAGDIAVPYNEISKKSYLLIKITARVMMHEDPDNIEGRLVVNMQHKGKGYSFRCLETKRARLKKDEWNYLEYYYLTPDFWDRRDVIQGYFWNLSDKNIFVDDLKLEAFEPLVDESVF